MGVGFVTSAQAQDGEKCDDSFTGTGRKCTLAERIVDPSGFVYPSWVIVRGIINILLILGLLAISFSNITRINIDTYTIKKALPNLLIGIVLANASLLIIRYIADISTVAIYFFVERSPGFDIEGQTLLFQDFIRVVLGNVGIGSLVQIINLTGGAAAFSAPLIVLVLGLILLIGMLWLALVMFIRLAAIYLLTILAPLAFVAYGIPGQEKYFTQWWQLFTKWMFILPAMTAVFWLILQISRQGGDSILKIAIMYMLFFFALAIPSKFGGSVIDKATTAFKKYSGTDAAVKASKEYAAQKGQQIGYRMPGVARFQGWREQQKANAEKDIDQLKRRGKAKILAGKTGLNKQKLEVLEKELASQELEVDANQRIKAGELRDRFGFGTTLDVREIRADYAKQKAEGHRDAEAAKKKLEYLDAGENKEELQRVFDKVNESTVLTGEVGKNEGIAKGNLAREELILSKHVDDYKKAKEIYDRLDKQLQSGQALSQDDLDLMNKNGQVMTKVKANYNLIIGGNMAGHGFFSGKHIEQAANAVGIEKTIISAKKAQSAKAVDAGVKATIEEALKNETLEEALASYEEIKDKDKLVKGDTLGVEMKDQHKFVSHTQKLVAWAGKQNDHRRDGALTELGGMLIDGKGTVNLNGVDYIDKDVLADAIEAAKPEDKKRIFRDIAKNSQFLVGSGGYQAGHYEDK